MKLPKSIKPTHCPNTQNNQRLESKSYKSTKPAFIMVECVLGLVLCALALGIVFSFQQYMSHRLASLHTQTSSGADMLHILSTAPQTSSLQTNTHTYEIQHYTYRKDMALPYTLHYFKPLSVR
ncbi:hypothetical protein [uncultured Helicobacter sp.]|uniref:hypothetical protein n=1 Tax=uncultured Helicobacter sp. TaxID=175537 RepID=UPI001C3AE4E2|nr:hypothetical protein [Candidatus Helicobacter avicola]